MKKITKQRKRKQKRIEFNFPFESDSDKQVQFKFNLAIYVAPKPANDSVHLTVMATETHRENSVLLIKHSLSGIDDVREFLTSPDFTVLFAKIFRENCFDTIIKFWKTIKVHQIKKKIEEIRTAHLKKPA